MGGVSYFKHPSEYLRGQYLREVSETPRHIYEEYPSRRIDVERVTRELHTTHDPVPLLPRYFFL